ncbi:hypothetical protein PV08_04480 [Exophiala spinifera]|uniref:Cyclin N-terminal domain-containing protein n=1 Tax=Exophiala spinifera TaxID=91928 RepID=A0A0D2C0T1_9EURO|nr:uncharacterized protein PV08_04480 [Exophiala spinifera]KIW17289.1 hypothetical protein PV08_04480 [Exophiala spinifera]
MGVGDMTGFFNTYNPQNVQGWLDTQGHYKVPESSWPTTQFKCKKDVDQTSVASVDDVLSVSDSSQGSTSSDSSSHTTWTSATDLGEVFLEDDEKDEQQSRCLSGPESQDYLLKGLHTREEISCSTRFPSAQLDQSAPSKVTGCSRVPSQSTRPPRGGEITLEPQFRKSSSRRSNSSGKSLSGPCKLKRDTDVTDHFVALLVCFATRLVTAIWPMSACPPMSSTCFNGAGVLPLRVFIQETLRRSKTSYSTLQVALYYLVLLKSKLPCASAENESPCRAMQCGRRMFLSALMLASKYLQDRNYSARAWSKISGLRSNEINENEREYLQLIDYELHVPKESFDVWSKIVLSLSRVTKEQPQCRSGSMSPGSSPPGSGSSHILADMVSQVGLDETTGAHTFTDAWWTDVISQLGPGLVKDSSLADDFLRRNLPADQMAQISAYYLEKHGKETPTTSPETARVYDINFSDSFKSSTARQEPTTPQNPIEMSPARASGLPVRPHLRNLPTPQTTPRVGDSFQWAGNGGKPSLRCSASADALRNMRKQCFVNANLERCPPPRPQGCTLPSMRTLLRPAETMREYSNRSTSSASPISVVSETPSLTSRSRSSSISSNSSWSSSMRSKGGSAEQFSSTLARMCSSTEEISKLPSATLSQPVVSFPKFCDEGYGSSEEPLPKTSKQHLSTSNEVDALQALMSLSTHSETPSQSVTPTPRRLAEQSILGVRPAISSSPRGHKRTLSRTNENIQNQVRRTLTDPRMVCNIIDDAVKPNRDSTPREWQLPARSWAEPRRALPNTSDNKRVATYCSIQQFASAPDLAAQYLQDSIFTAS